MFKPMPLSESKIQEKLSALNGWLLLDGQIQKTYSLKDFQSAMQLVNQVAMIAEKLNHHPDINIRYSKVTFMLYTHSEDSLTEKDFEMAKNIEQTAVNII